jgi:CRP-like cAMP-binding protein
MGNESILKNVYLFNKMNPSQISSIADISEFKSFEAGEDIFFQGNAAEYFYIISYGSVRIHQKNTINENIEIAILGPESHFGEMAFLDGKDRSASATCMESTGLTLVNFAKLKTVLEKDTSTSSDFYQEITKFLVNRLRVITLDLSYARERNLSHF